MRHHVRERHTLRQRRHRARAGSDRRGARRMRAVHVEIQNGRAAPRARARARGIAVGVAIAVAAAAAGFRRSPGCCCGSGGGGSCSGSGRCSLVGFLLVEEVSQAGDAGAGEDAEDVALVFVKLRRGLAAEDEQLVAQEGLHARQGEVGEFGAVVEEDVDALETHIHKLAGILAGKGARR